jgi:NitT/TauT family transport system ATP-binding protein
MSSTSAPTLAEGAINVSGLSVRYTRRERTQTALADVNLTISRGEFVALLGPSGCGKTTLLHAIAGIVKPSKGSVRVSGEIVREPTAHTGIVFQQHSLFPWMTALENVAFGPRRLGRSDALTIARRGLASVGLGDFADAYPAQLSGGMRQRVGLARALAIDPPVLLMDEPFGALDAMTREAMQELLLTIWRQRNNTVVFVTHDVEEAVFLSDRIVVMDTAPSRVRAEFEVDLPRPRTFDTRRDFRFQNLRKTIGQLIREKADREMAPAVAPLSSASSRVISNDPVFARPV